MIKDRLRKWRNIIIILFLILVFSIILCLAIGPVYIPPDKVFRIVLSSVVYYNTVKDSHYNIILKLRLPRIIMGVLTGIALSLSGTVMQTLFRNPMADPYIIGLSTGAALGATISIVLLPPTLGIYTIPLLAFIGSIGTVLLVFIISNMQGGLKMDVLLLTGIAISYLESAITWIIIWCFFEDKHLIVFWTLGGLWRASWLKVKIALIPILLSSILIYLFSKDLNVLLLGEEHAQSLGVNVDRCRKVSLILSSLMTSTVVSFTGVIGFVGLIIPHMLRLIVGPDHRILIPSSILAGATFLIWTDTLARCLMEIPVGVVTSLFGIPFFLHLLIRRRRGRVFS